MKGKKAGTENQSARLGGLWRMNWEQGRSTACSGCSNGRLGAKGFAITGAGGFLLHRPGLRVGRAGGRLGLRVRFLLDFNDVLVRDLPAEVLVLAAEFEVLLEKNGAAGVG